MPWQQSRKGAGPGGIFSCNAGAIGMAAGDIGERVATFEFGEGDGDGGFGLLLGDVLDLRMLARKLWRLVGAQETGR